MFQKVDLRRPNGLFAASEVRAKDGDVDRKKAAEKEDEEADVADA